jgi:hypothetical protein
VLQRRSFLETGTHESNDANATIRRRVDLERFLFDYYAKNFGALRRMIKVVYSDL